ncbi:PREDICTED: uncharacterized protein CG10915 [Ceratosolen solmsi marchali]|uniref:Uncharacterized protein CG10915 n=1 Tax=Ceratosolen solmsi marchali TaxID=326594 RepID=A0AAJ6YRS4_9HYME|nr:PREDICTED: uncharacterized protein CG10915 [Ceratosolen solmsi marchali]
MATQGQSNTINGPPGVSSSKNAMSVSPQPQQQQQQQSNNFEPLDKSSSNTLKRNPKMELCKTDLLKLLGYLEGELQARDVVIAALKSEKMKHFLSSRYRSGTTDPHSALARDSALVGGALGPQLSQIDQLGATLEALVTRQRRMLSHMAKILKSAELRHRMVLNELEEEMQKHDHDTAQGDDITYGLEKERIRLKKELEAEKQEKQHLEDEIKKMNDLLDDEKKRHKQIVLVLLAERKKIIMKYIEERKRSEDLSQILGEEKVRTESMAKGLEEESKKSLLMGAEMEEQQVQFDICKTDFLNTIYSKDKKLAEQQSELEKVRVELEVMREQQPSRGAVRGLGVTPPPPPPPAKPVRTDSISDGLKKEMKPFLMGTDLEEQQLQFEICKSDFLNTIFNKDKKLSEQQGELDKLRAELEALKEQQQQTTTRGPVRVLGVTPPPPPAKPANLAAMPNLRTAATPSTVKGAALGAGTPMVSSKVVQPTATVSSVPVSGPTTGIARSVTPGQVLRSHCVGYGQGITTAPVIESMAPAPTQETAFAAATTPSQETVAAQVNYINYPSHSTTSTKRPSDFIAFPQGLHKRSATGASTPGTAKKSQVVQAQPSLIVAARGAPPPVPPNKPVVPPKKEVAAAFLRRAEQQQHHHHQDSKHFIKQISAVQLSNQQQSTTVVGTTNDDEVRVRALFLLRMELMEL